MSLPALLAESFKNVTFISLATVGYISVVGCNGRVLSFVAFGLLSRQPFLEISIRPA